MDRALTIEVRRETEYVLVRVAGEVDIATVSGLRERLWALATAGRPVVVDLERVTFIDAGGLGVLASSAGRAAAHGSSLYVVCTRRQTRRLFRLTGLERRIPLAASLDEALLQLAVALGKPARRQ